MKPNINKPYCIWTLPEADADFSTRWRSPVLGSTEFMMRCGEPQKALFLTVELGWNSRLIDLLHKSKISVEKGVRSQKSEVRSINQKIMAY